MPNSTLNEWRTVVTDDGTFYVHRYRIATTPVVIYAAYEDIAETRDGRHRTTATMPDGHRVGQVTSRPLPDELAALEPYTTERRHRVTAWQRERRDAALAVIRAAFPDIETRRGGKPRMGDYETRELEGRD